MKAISPELQSLLSVAAAVLDASGRLLEANEGFMRLLPAGPERRIGSEVADCFELPRFAELAAAQAAANGEVFRGTMRLRNAAGASLELRGRVWRAAFGLCVLAESDLAASEPSAHASEAQSHLDAQQEVQVVEASLTDKLTGIGNRECLDQILTTEIARVRRTGLPLSILMTGPDLFERFQESAGPAGTDILLARFGFLLRLLTRPTDIPTRNSTAEFVVVLPHTNLAQAAAAAERIRKAIESDPVEAQREPVTASFGVVELQIDEGGVTLLERARSALQSARDAGQNRVMAADAS